MDSRTQLVEAGYDAIADRFVDWRARIQDDPRERWRQELVDRLPERARVLELGCGAGVPDTQLLAERFSVTGVDVSSEQLRRARANVPAADFMQADFTSLDLEASSFDAVVAFYVSNHVPRDLLPSVLADIGRWLVPGGLLLTVFGTSDTEAWTGDWLGTTMFFSSFPPATNSRLVDEAGFERLRDEIVTVVEPEPDGEGQWQWVLARR